MFTSRSSLLWRVRRALTPEVVIHGRFTRAWMAALDRKAPVWKLLPVRLRKKKDTRRWWRKRVAVPLVEYHIASVPAGHHVLAPSAEALKIFADKALFADYVQRIGAGDLVPRPISLEAPTFPAILKRTDLNAGRGVARATSQEELDSLLSQIPFAGEHVILQECIDTPRDLVTFAVAVKGRIVWHATYVYPLEHSQTIRGPVGEEAFERVSASSEDIAAFERLLKPLHYDGPVNIDYRRRPDGSLAVLEANPRLGGSLMRPENTDDLAGCLRAIIRHARWRPPDNRGRVARWDRARA